MTRKRTRSLRSDTSPSSPATASTRGFVSFCCAAVLFCFVLKTPSLVYAHVEGDERIYWQLAENLAHGEAYSLRGTALLKNLSAYIYDRPLFHHPPLFPLLLAPFAMAGAESAAVLVSWLGHALAVLAVAFIGRDVVRRQTSGVTIASPAFWLPVLGVATDPLLMFVSRRLWVDSVLSGLIAASVAALLLSDGSRRRLMLASAGFLLGLAALAKLTALILVPVFLYACIRQDETWKQRALSMLTILIPVAALVMPWLVLFYVRSGVFVPSWVKPDAKLAELYPFIREALDRPWFYYAVKLVFIMPVGLVALWAAFRVRLFQTNWTAHVSVAWFGVVFVAITAMSIGGYGFQMRHVSPAVTALYVVLLVSLAERERPVLLMVSTFAMIIGTVTGAMHLLAPQADEIVSLARFAGLSGY